MTTVARLKRENAEKGVLRIPFFRLKGGMRQYHPRRKSAFFSLCGLACAPFSECSAALIFSGAKCIGNKQATPAMERGALRSIAGYGRHPAMLFLRDFIVPE
ncbi:hypothetical protein N657DRAFT_631914 [Parathielavia appendiculata]|uniref:Uncharacterized protein n=1 Tax=Parathielavia appendiculata TaxID=2587402 RepID=A0AAN6U3B3_9PEZI|nr:hypothetical protein N657DRAFT_631914 [Parathielavia appendiculata]